MIHEGRDQATALHPTAIDLDPVVTAAADDAIGLQAADDGGEAVALLHPELMESLHPGRAVGEARGNSEDGELVDHRGSAGGRNLDPAERRAADPDVAEELTTRLAPVFDREAGAHLLERLHEAGAGGVEQDAVEHDL